MQLRAEQVERRLHRLAWQREAEAGEFLNFEPDALVGDRRLGDDAAQRALKFDGAVGRVRIHPVDEAPDERDGLLNRLLDAVGGPGDGGIQRSDGALRVAGVRQSDVVDLDVGLHPLGIANLVARGGDRDVAVVPGHVLNQEWARAERGRCTVLHDACRRFGHHLVGAVAGVELDADDPGDHQRQHDDQDQHQRQRIAEYAFEERALAGWRTVRVARLGRRVVLRWWVRMRAGLCGR